MFILLLISDYLLNKYSLYVKTTTEEQWCVATGIKFVYELFLVLVEQKLWYYAFYVLLMTLSGEQHWDGMSRLAYAYFVHTYCGGFIASVYAILGCVFVYRLCIQQRTIMPELARML